MPSSTVPNDLLVLTSSFRSNPSHGVSATPKNPSKRSAPQNILQDIVPVPQFLGPITQELSLPLRRRRFRRDGLHLGVLQPADNNRGEDFLDVAHDVAFDHLGGDVGDEGFLGDLRGVG